MVKEALGKHGDPATAAREVVEKVEKFGFMFDGRKTTDNVACVIVDLSSPSKK